MSTQHRSQEERPLSTRVRRRPLIIILAVLGLIFVASYTGRLAEYRRLQVEKSAVQTQILESEAKGRQLAAALEYVNSFEFVEKMAITKLGMAREGDQVLTVIDAPTSTRRAVEAMPADMEKTVKGVSDPPSVSGKPPIWRQWVSVFVSERE